MTAGITTTGCSIAAVTALTIMTTSIDARILTALRRHA
jgi:hypothetical protein